MFSDKLEKCPECARMLTQSGYDGQYCACGWGPFGKPSSKAFGELTVEEALILADRDDDRALRTLATEVRRLRRLCGVLR